MKGRRILVCIGGGIAAYKACELIRLLVKAGAEVRAAMTPAAQRFVTPLTVQALAGRPVATDLFDAGQDLAAGHISLADWAELAIVAPATADLLGRLALGLADDVVTTTLIAIEPSKWLVAPAMNEKMWASPAVTANVKTLASRGARIVGPGVGEMAERSHVGPGRMLEATEIFAAASAALRPQDLAGVRVLVTAGPTREALDPVRFISNPSTGRMGFAIAEAARDRGAQVTLIAGPTEVPAPSGVETVRIVSAEDLAHAVDAHLAGVRVVVMTAAVADQRPKERAAHKAKKKDGEETVVLVRTPDILAGLGARADKPMLVGFAAETQNVEAYAREKLQRKALDFIVANDVGGPGAGFAATTNEVVVLDRFGGRNELRGTKADVAHGLWDLLHAKLP